MVSIFFRKNNAQNRVIPEEELLLCLLFILVVCPCYNSSFLFYQKFFNIQISQAFHRKQMCIILQEECLCLLFCKNQDLFGKNVSQKFLIYLTSKYLKYAISISSLNLLNIERKPFFNEKFQVNSFIYVFQKMHPSCHSNNSLSPHGIRQASLKVNHYNLNR